MKTVTHATLADLAAEAAAAPRRRKNRNLHEHLDDPIQRLLNALEPGTYIRPHRHPDGVWELFTLLSGACSILVFDAQGVVTQRVDLAQDGTLAAEIPAGAWHGVVARRPGTVVIEVKPGPYVPGSFAAWAPEEGSDGAATCLDWLQRAQVGESFGHD
ncbi:WbuC family cupin fold metalloprotein [Magnetospirillum gryphiswaldense]|nr:WbuC family cupin fold metalloprotein [Magnetospirillum gryphiswaldense]